MNQYLLYSGIIANVLLVIFLAVIIFKWFIWPAVIATSQCRCYCAMTRIIGKKITLYGLWRKWWDGYIGHLIIGQTYETVRCRYFEWHGVGKWKVYSGEDGDGYYESDDNEN